tara:strand:- start:62 stop:1432 length:1371 start_codon:yes stop_codon:yes gene_type:complete
MKKIIIVIILFINADALICQENYSKCNTTKLVNNELKNNVNYLKARNNIPNLNNTNFEKTTITIPIVIHIVHKISHSTIGTGTNISNEQIESQLQILNEDYSRTNPEFTNPPRTTFSNYWGNPDLKFCLATTDPNGNPTTGITRTATSQVNWDADDDSSNPCHEANGMKKNSCGGKDGWDPSRYLNIWVCDLINSQSNGMTLGYAYLPGLLADFNSSNDYKDGLVVDYRYFGTTGVAAPSSDGRTATHEIGHYLGLMHTFCEETDAQGNWLCCDNDNTNWGGYVDDTPATKDIYFGPVNASTNNNTCNDLNYGFNTDLLDMDENFMAYSANTWMFSQGQTNVMLNTLNREDWLAGRLNLKNSNVSSNCSGIISYLENINTKINISISPNPTTGELIINTNDDILSITIYNLIGEEITSEMVEKNNILDLRKLINGIYYVNITTEKGMSTKKIILCK